MRGIGLFVVVGALACGPPPRPIIESNEPPPELAESADAGVDAGRARAIIQRADAAIAAKDFERARKLKLDAEPFANEALGEELRELGQRIDKGVAIELAPRVLELAAGGECQKAAENAAEIANAASGTAVIVYLRAEVGQAVLDCLLKALAIDTSIGREFAESKAIRTALSPSQFETWTAQVDEATIGVLVESLGAPMRRREWVAVVRALDDMVKQKETGTAEVAKMMQFVRAGIAEDIEAKASAGLGESRGAGPLVVDIDKLIAAARWDETRGEPVPAAVRSRRSEAVFWSVCAAQGCRLVSPAKPAWTFGRASVRPLGDISADADIQLPHARKVWRVADGRSFALIAEKAPGDLTTVLAALPVALGWVSTGSLRASETSEMMPPGDAIVTTRVWGAFRPGQKTWEMGVVTGVKGAELDVERVADRKVVKAQRGAVRFGTVRAGTKVLADCGGDAIRLVAAIIDDVRSVGRGDPIVRVTCLDASGAATGAKKELQLGSLRAEPRAIP
ncbi:MAG: hypothetical protein EXR75_00995 [Myxococcales bacterium]|nr:hypothetical protein [Myxococcales bacterium]